MIAALLMGVGMAGADQWIAEYFHREKGWVYRVAEVLSWFGQAGWYLVPAGILYGLARRARFELLGRLTGFLFLAVALSALITDGLKYLIGRTRPWVWFSDHFHGFHPLTFNSNWQSLPSGHATTAVAAALSLSVIFPRWLPYLLGIGLAIAFSRVVVYAHYLSDVVAGAVVGGLTVELLRRWLLRRRGPGETPAGDA